VTQCTDCDGGKHCSVEGSTSVTGDCDAGYYCQSGVDRPNPDNSATNSTYPPTCPLIGGHTGNSHFSGIALIFTLSFRIPVLTLIVLLSDFLFIIYLETSCRSLL